MGSLDDLRVQCSFAGIFTGERRQALDDDVGRAPTNALMETAENVSFMEDNFDMN